MRVGVLPLPALVYLVQNLPPDWSDAESDGLLQSPHEIHHQIDIPERWSYKVGEAYNDPEKLYCGSMRNGHRYTWYVRVFPMRETKEHEGVGVYICPFNRDQTDHAPILMTARIAMLDEPDEEEDEVVEITSDSIEVVFWNHGVDESWGTELVLPEEYAKRYLWIKVELRPVQHSWQLYLIHYWCSNPVRRMERRCKGLIQPCKPRVLARKYQCPLSDLLRILGFSHLFQHELGALAQAVEEVLKYHTARTCEEIRDEPTFDGLPRRWKDFVDTKIAENANAGLSGGRPGSAYTPQRSQYQTPGQPASRHSPALHARASPGVRSPAFQSSPR